MAAIELLEDLRHDYKRLSAAAMVAGNVWNAGVVLGAPVTDWRRLDLAAVTARLTINGREIGTGKGGDVMGNPLNALAWLADKLAAVGTPLKRGTIVMTGSMVPIQFPADGALINRMGFNSGGLDMVVGRLSARPGRGIVGVNLGKNRDSEDAAADYLEGVRRVARIADYLVVNVSSPNTPGLRDLQARAVLETLLRQLLAVRDEAGPRAPLLVKIAPDLTPEERRDIAAVTLATQIDGIIVANTTVARPPRLRSAAAAETGGL